jgi:NAD(P)-dependent dehydrogenase (short-subunit alcohol dehydrogenase family)
MKGSIISILATWVWTGSPFVVPSAMSKSALNTMTKSLAVEWGPHGIQNKRYCTRTISYRGCLGKIKPKGDLDDSNSMSTIPMGRVGEMSELTKFSNFFDGRWMRVFNWSNNCT